MEMQRVPRFVARPLAGFLAAVLGAVLPAAPAHAQTRLLPLGDSITHGGQGHASYRYRLWQRLLQSGRDVDLVGLQSQIDGGDPPNLAWYPDYSTWFDRDHEGHWGWRTDQIAAILPGVLTATLPDVVIVHLGTNDVGQSGAAGVANAEANLRGIVGLVRAARPGIPILLAQVVPIGPGTSYFANAGEITTLNAAIAAIAADSNRVDAPVAWVDQHTGFDLGTMMQPDGLHPDTTGENRMAEAWHAALLPWIPAGNPRPFVALLAPTNGATVAALDTVPLLAQAFDANGSVVRVRFLADSIEIAVDEAAPFEATWVAEAGVHAIEAIAEDDGGATRRSPPVAIEATPPGSGEAIAVPNASFELPPLADGALAAGPGAFDGWVFAATPATYLGIFDPPAGSYPEAAGAGTPLGADGENVAYLFNNGGPSEQVEAATALAETLSASFLYRLRVAIGRFLPNQPYAFSTWGGYRIELRAGPDVIAAEENVVSPAEGRFADAEIAVRGDTLPAAWVGRPLSIRLALGTDQAPRSTHFDRVRLTREGLTLGVPTGGTNALAGPRAFPNPAGSEARVWFATRRPGPIWVDLLDPAGRRVASIAEGRWFGAGSHVLSFRLPYRPGIYLVRVRDGASAKVVRVVRL
jgi:lysophospholipase L1-like esterase